MRRFTVMALALVAAGCTVETSSQPPVERPETVASVAPTVTRTGRPQTLADFRTAARRMEPVSERTCRELRPGANCDFQVNIDTRSGVPNAWQSYNDAGRPQITITPELIAQMRNHDELAFVFAHEAAHHIEQHIDQTVDSARAGAVFGAILGSVAGLDPSGVDVATNIGGTVGARRFSKEFELEADSLGARITERAGYDAVRGVLYFVDARDPGNQFLGTHPPNAERIGIVRRTVGR